jgi:hypothetical protein
MRVSQAAEPSGTLGVMTLLPVAGVGLCLAGSVQAAAADGLVGSGGPACVLVMTVFKAGFMVLLAHVLAERAGMAFLSGYASLGQPFTSVSSAIAVICAMTGVAGLGFCRRQVRIGALR